MIIVDIIIIRRIVDNIDNNKKKNKASSQEMLSALPGMASGSPWHAALPFQVLGLGIFWGFRGVRV